MSDSVRHHPWDSPGKNTGVGCQFLLQCIKVKSESEVAHSCLTLHDPMDCSLPGSSIHGIFQARVLEWGAIAFSLKECYLCPNINFFIAYEKLVNTLKLFFILAYMLLLFLAIVLLFVNFYIFYILYKF